VIDPGPEPGEKDRVSSNRRLQSRSCTVLGGLVLLGACATIPVTTTPTSAEAPPPAIPTKVDLRPEFAALALQPRSQGNRPTCSVFTVTAALEFANARATGVGQRLSVEYLNWAANAATGRTDDGDFFHFLLQGYERFGVCPEAAMPYAKTFLPGAQPSPDALVAGGRFLARMQDVLRIRWIRPIVPGTSGLDATQFKDVLRTLASGWPVAAGSSHSRLLVGYRDDTARPGGGCFLTLDSGIGGYAEVDYDFVRTRVNDAFVVDSKAAR
jgi:hypothetical protein